MLWRLKTKTFEKSWSDEVTWHFYYMFVFCRSGVHKCQRNIDPQFKEFSLTWYKPSWFPHVNRADWPRTIICSWKAGRSAENNPNISGDFGLPSRYSPKRIVGCTWTYWNSIINVLIELTMRYNEYMTYLYAKCSLNLKWMEWSS